MRYLRKFLKALPNHLFAPLGKKLCILEAQERLLFVSHTSEKYFSLCCLVLIIMLAFIQLIYVQKHPPSKTRKNNKTKILFAFANIFTSSQPFIEPLAENKTTRMLTKKKCFCVQMIIYDKILQNLSVMRSKSMSSVNSLETKLLDGNKNSS